MKAAIERFSDFILVLLLAALLATAVGRADDYYQFPQTLSDICDASGGMIYFDGTQFQCLGIGTNGKILKVTAGLPSWQNDATGTVTSVAMTVPSWLSVAGSPITTSGTLAVTAATGQSQNQVLATPNGSTGALSVRALVGADLPFTGTPDGTKFLRDDYSWQTVSSGVSTVGPFSGSSQTNGASIAGSTITFGPADGTNPGMVSTSTQTFAGQKTFTGVTIHPDGTGAAPSVAIGFSDTGLMRSQVSGASDHALGFATAGTQRWYISGIGTLAPAADSSYALGDISTRAPTNVVARTAVQIGTSGGYASLEPSTIKLGYGGVTATITTNATLAGAAAPMLIQPVRTGTGGSPTVSTLTIAGEDRGQSAAVPGLVTVRGGDISVSGGSGAATAGSVLARGGDATLAGSNSHGGDYTIRGGNGEGTGNAGNAYIQPGVPGSGTVGVAAMRNSSGTSVLKVSGTDTVPTLDGLTASRLVATDGSKKLASVAYTDANTASAVVQRDGSGNFSAGQITSSSGVRLDTSAAQPTCDATIRGLNWIVQGGAGVADIQQTCMKKSDDAYAWVTVATAP